MRFYLCFLIIITSITILPLYAADESPQKSRLSLNIDFHGGYGFIFGTEGRELKLFGDEDNEISYNNYQNGWLGGLQVGIAIPTRVLLELQPFIGFQYYNKTLSAHVRDEKESSGWFDNDDDIFEARYTLNLHYMDITAGCRIFISIFYIDAGLYYGLELSKYRKSSSISASGSFTEDQIKDMLNAHNDFGLLLGAGLAIPLHEHVRFLAGCRVQIGFLDTVTLREEASSSFTSVSVYAGISTKIYLQ